MSPVVLVDSVVVIGAMLEDDEHHTRGSEIFHAIDDGDLPPAILHDYVYAEIVNYLTKAVSLPQSKLHDILDRLDSTENFRIYRVADSHFEQGKNTVYFDYSDLSLTDAISVSFMEDTGIEYLYSFDSGFDSVDSIKRLNAAVSPY